ncbi:copper homeostasis protein CutC [Rosenbergiella australiborealis]|uniref:PF03932 family protein CutC n=1 Tax=Rosenbergiella australiborealis TaxID=1544696 RepID=A0ABS5T7C0_9GAMM|nr:copper homeostasis protein CutC [Rosenbergiella australiborealis]MBT0728260.1 copper homeostasis protein CutC [Rosenbergiella australiborealis]
MPTLEICCYGLDCALSAAQAGADRLELCAAPQEGGLTTSLGTLREVRSRIHIPVHPIVRPRSGDFCYSDNEFKIMLSDIAQIRDMGFPGVVTGILCPEGLLDKARMQKMMTVAKGMAVTFHRAFDLCSNPHRTYHELADLGVARILTSGQQQSAEAGLPLLQELNAIGTGPIIMAGAGVRLSNLPKFLEAGIKEVHSSASRQVPSAMNYCKAGVSMCSDKVADEYLRTEVDPTVVEAMQTLIRLQRDAQPTILTEHHFGHLDHLSGFTSN